MINLKIHSLTILLILTCTATNTSFAMGKENSAVLEALAMVKAQQPTAVNIERPSTPLNPDNNAHRPFINFLQTADGRPVTANDVYNYVGFYPTR